ncbi:MAG: hypothetical protein A3G49_00575 [Candidatus Sungbacteria bacterium RIFCSPLOWO2_12_FULL_41_11]|uniref:Uncharacterized protein n=1 Tax=Candidatus Sungbacteria bacterium RIFCSPLOWO2_12_FULL_41_11 TaxID=1802286 RepID=A0A1G2LMX8_9BACT|nr:MAG: hypothetical protein UV01_C0009G0021 [Parcubacteria group bacterium GW2011_GWA2_42_14]OGZ99457.1 MAG: hypothetical protein A3D41_00830 [Candidatus Sungbacteria bacterium RIFCSPHIGHO2_02_FULL_41_12b]OHA12977.1 MAG: hypothetical protein A3G49_00575 [Candidatus Sungbacteria bacterium RIFCSPLOWO2_12_FULL_41_11]
MFSNLGYRASRQFILLLIPFTIAAILLLFGYYKLLPEPTCSDLIKNQNEEEVDCGGPCKSCLFKHIQDIQIFSVNFDEVVTGSYDVVAKVKNPNTRLLAKEFFYEITLKDDKGVIMQKRTGRSYLYAGETAHIIEGNIPSKRKIYFAEFSINNKEVNWIQGETKRPVFLSGEKISEVVRGTTRLKLKIFNQSLADFKNIEVGAIITNDNGDITAINKTLIDSLKAGDFVPFIFIWPGEFIINTANVLIEPRVNLTAG